MLTQQILGRGISWQVVRVERIIDENGRVKTFTLRPPEWKAFRPGQHVDIRLTAADGYQAQRSYSIASPPEQESTIDLTVDRIEDGEVSPYLHDVLRPGDEFEIRGPIGGPFTWTVHDGGPLLLTAAGSGIVPLMSMLRHRAANGSTVPALLLYSSRAPQDIIYGDELCPGHASSPGLTVFHTFTRHPPPEWTGYDRRIDATMLSDVLRQIESVAHAFVCGPTPFVEHVARLLVSAGIAPDLVRTERFGPSGS